MNLRRLQDGVAICRLPPDAGTPAWAWRAEGFVSVTRTVDEWSVVCDPDAIPAGTPTDAGWSVLQVEGPLDFALTGILSAISGCLAEAGISLFAISTYDTDYVLVKSGRLEDAVRALESAGHRVD